MFLLLVAGEMSILAEQSADQDSRQQKPIWICCAVRICHLFLDSTSVCVVEIACSQQTKRGTPLCTHVILVQQLVALCLLMCIQGGDGFKPLVRSPDFEVLCNQCAVLSVLDEMH